MVAFRRCALAFAFLAFGGSALAQDAGSVWLELTDPPGSLRIVNAGPTPAVIQMAIVVHEAGGGWLGCHHHRVQCRRALRSRGFGHHGHDRAGERFERSALAWL